MADKQRKGSQGLPLRVGNGALIFKVLRGLGMFCSYGLGRRWNWSMDKNYLGLERNHQGFLLAPVVDADPDIES